MTISFFELENWEKEYLKDKFPNHKLNLFSDTLDIRDIKKVKDSEIISVFIYSQVNQKLLSKLPKLKLINTSSTGFEHIDAAYCNKRGIKVCNVPYYGENTVAEHAFALLLTLVKNIHKSWERTRRSDFSLKGLRGFDLQGKTLGIIGMGHIGQHMARMARGFEMKVAAFDPHKLPKLAQELGFKYVSLNTLLKNSDVISLHAPYNEHTHYLINKQNIKIMKKGVVLINTARGGLIETEALIRGLEKKIIGAVGLDVLEGECVIKEEKQLLSPHFRSECDLKIILQDHLLLQYDNVIVTPHNAFNSWEALQRILDTTVKNIQGFLRGRASNVVKV